MGLWWIFKKKKNINKLKDSYWLVGSSLSGVLAENLLNLYLAGLSWFFSHKNSIMWSSCWNSPLQQQQLSQIFSDCSVVVEVGHWSPPANLPEFIFLRLMENTLCRKGLGDQWHPEVPPEGSGFIFWNLTWTWHWRMEASVSYWRLFGSREGSTAITTDGCGGCRVPGWLYLPVLAWSKFDTLTNFF